MDNVREKLGESGKCSSRLQQGEQGLHPTPHPERYPSGDRSPGRISTKPVGSTQGHSSAPSFWKDSEIPNADGGEIPVRRVSFVFFL